MDHGKRHRRDAPIRHPKPVRVPKRRGVSTPQKSMPCRPRAKTRAIRCTAWRGLRRRKNTFQPPPKAACGAAEPSTPAAEAPARPALDAALQTQPALQRKPPSARGSRGSLATQSLSLQRWGASLQRKTPSCNAGGPWSRAAGVSASIAGAFPIVAGASASVAGGFPSVSGAFSNVAGGSPSVAGVSSSVSGASRSVADVIAAVGGASPIPIAALRRAAGDPVCAAGDSRCLGGAFRRVAGGFDTAPGVLGEVYCAG
jgi:hypothetical protein